MIKITILSIKPKYAELIYSGTKRWEFRRAPPPVPSWVYLYESAPVSKITGKVFLGFKVQGESGIVWNLVKKQRLVGGGPGISQKVFNEYVGKASSVAACATFFANKFPEAVSLPDGCRPPQNWGCYVVEDKEGEDLDEA